MLLDDTEKFGAWWEFTNDHIPSITNCLQEIRRFYVTRLSQPASVVTCEDDDAITISVVVGCVKVITVTCKKEIRDAPEAVSADEQEKQREFLSVVPSALKEWGEACAFKILTYSLDEWMDDTRSVDVGYTNDCLVLTYHVNVYCGTYGTPTVIDAVVHFHLADDAPEDVITIGRSIQSRMKGFIARELTVPTDALLAPMLIHHLNKVLQKMFGPTTNFSWEYGHYAHYVGWLTDGRAGYIHHRVFSHYRDLTYQDVDVSLRVTPVPPLDNPQLRYPIDRAKCYSPLHNDLENFLRANYVTCYVLEHDDNYVCYHIQDNAGAITLELRVGEAGTFDKPEGMEEL